MTATTHTPETHEYADHALTGVAISATLHCLTG